MVLSQKELEEAIKRHEENFEKELREVDIREVVLKTKKAVLEQSLKNNTTYDHVLDQNYRINSLQSKIDSYERKLERLEKDLANTKTVFAQAVSLLQEQAKPQPQPGFFTKFGDFLKCLLK